MGCNIEKERKGKGNSKSKQRIHVTVLISKNGGRHENFRHQAEKDKTHPAQKESLRVKSKKKMSITFKKRTRNVRKSKKIKIGGERVSLVSLVMQISLASRGGKKYLRRPCGHYHLNHQCVSL